MNADFHFYATYCASIIAGYNSEEARRIAYAANFVDYCSVTILKTAGLPTSSATTQTDFELIDFNTDVLGLQEITRIWSCFHFLPGDLYAPVKRGGRNYKSKYRLICQPNGKLVVDTIKLVKNGSLEGIGMAMHILADTWAHRNFVGTPSLVINNTERHFYEVYNGKDYLLNFVHSLGKADNIDKRRYTKSIYQTNENSIMNLGHGRAGHLPDLSYLTYKYMPAWADYEMIIKDNPSDYFNAFSQMIYALKYLRGTIDDFKLNTYEPLGEYEEKVKAIICKRQLDADDDWREFGEELSHTKIEPFDVFEYQNNHLKADNKETSFFANYCYAALQHKSMVTNRIYKSGNLLAGYSVEYNGVSINGFKDYWKLFKHELKVKKHE